MKTWICVLFLNLLAAATANAQTVDGDWQGTLKAGPAELRLVLHVSKDDKGNLKATLDSPDQGANGIPVTKITLAESMLSFEVQRIGGSFEGKVNAGATGISGTWRQLGSSLPLELARAAPVQTKNRVPKPSDIDGDWEGVLDTGGATLRLVLHIATFEDGVAAKLDSLDQAAAGMPVTTFTRKGTSVDFEMKQIAGSFSGTVDAALATISGTWTQLGNSRPLAFKRVRKTPDVFPLASLQERSADGVVINDEGLPQYSTFSLCAIDPATGQSGASVTTRVPFVGRAVPHVRAGVGAVCTQASTVVEYGPRGLDLLAKGVEPQAVLAQLLADDQSRESRQVGVIDMKGRAAAHTGKQNGNWAGSRQGLNYTVQANIMVGPEVVEAVATQFESTEGTGMPLAERMILAMEAGQAKGGDRRWGNLQSAAIKIADPNDPGRGGDYIALAIEVGENPEPVAELKRIYYTTGRRLGYRSFSQVEGADVIELKRMLHALGYWRPSLAAFPDAPPSTNTPKMVELRKTDPAQYDKLIAESRKATADYNRDYAQYDGEAIAAVDKFRADRSLNYQGNPPGLVDARMIEALRAAYVAKKKSAAKR
jgi:uncharacterized Ntn-hydrolase superfamily protein